MALISTPEKRPEEESPAEQMQSRLWGWGRLAVPGRELRSENLEELTRDAVLSRGLGRSYGDSSLPPPSHPEVAGTVLADRILAFDKRTGILRAEAGLSLLELNRLFLRRGWFTPVTPGTQYVTLGGMVAADVHGKNHHVAGTFGQHVTALKMLVADGRVLECTPQRESELFWATVGGMGLTGHILEVEFRMVRIPSPWIHEESERRPNLASMIEGLQQAKTEWPMTVGWIDCLSRGKNMGRGILFCGRWAEREEAPEYPPPRKARVTVPFTLPGIVLGHMSVAAFNSLLYWWHGPERKKHIVHPEKFFYPLDFIGEWNRLYGRRGLTQYQCVMPEGERPGCTQRFLELLVGTGAASFLSVIKDCGPEGQGLLSFPKPGISIAVDLPVHGDTKQIVDRLNELVVSEGGRVYLAKDAFTSMEHFCRMEPRLSEWQRIRRAWDPEGRLRSAQSVRMMGDRP